MSILHDSPGAPSTNGAQYRARSYQLEMLEHSLKRNIIVAMDTGSGKTHIAVLRIMSALEQGGPDQLVWFLGTTVALCTQQYGVLCAHIPAAKIKLLLGSDNVDRWSEKSIWDAALKDVHIVVSTHAILADALSHGFVTMARLNLLIFDEAHHCARRHPANQIMQDFYHPTKTEGGSVPNILGLTASPIKSSKLRELQTIENNLDSISITPRLHRQELLKHIHRPDLIPLRYFEYDAESHVCTSSMLSKLLSLCREEKVMIDITANVDNHQIQPQQVLSLKGRNTSFSRDKFCTDQLRKFHSKAQHIYEELGQWAADYFIMESIRLFKETVDLQRGIFDEWQNSEKVYIRRVLAKLEISDFDIGVPLRVSNKLESLISYLSSKNAPDFSGLLFVQQRATASVLAALLSTHPETKEYFRCAPYVGLSNSGMRKQNIGELLDYRAICNTLDDFKERRKNLIISTDVLEEGIDVTACNMVICFNKIPTLKSFIQRRGRARQQKSTYAIMLANNDKSSKIDFFEKLEQEMNSIYQDEERLQREAAAREAIREEVTEIYIVNNSQARVTPDTSIKHIHHFCNKLRREQYADPRPTFQISEQETTGLLQATLILPSCVSSTVRRTRGSKWWQTEHEAKKDAALQAYKALHNAGLLSDHLLPYPRQSHASDNAPLVQIPSTIDIRAQYDPWEDLAKAWAQSQFHHATLCIEHRSGAGANATRLLLTTPLALPDICPFEMYWDSDTTITVTPKTSLDTSYIEPASIKTMRDITHLFMRSVHSDKSQDHEKDYIILLTPDLEICRLQTWVDINQGKRSALQQFVIGKVDNSLGFVRTSLRNNAPHIFHRWRPARVKDEKDESELEVECFPLPKRRNFLQSATLSKIRRFVDDPGTEKRTPSGMQVFPASSCTIDLLPYEQAQIGLLVPSILHHFQVKMIALQLRQIILKDVTFSNVDNIVEAITASSAQWITNYQRLEFLGDSVLKFIISHHLFVNYPKWHEGYLSARRASLVSNDHLAQAALDAGLDAFIITEELRHRKWTIPKTSDTDRWLKSSRTVGSKILADVVEALIGAAYLEGSIPTAINCMKIFLIGIQSQLLETSIIVHPQLEKSRWLLDAERLIGYDFRNKGLLREALTHPSYEKDASSESYQRLEFLGDAVLDMVLVIIFSENKNHLSHGDMTKIKAALVNAELLAFFCLNHKLPYVTNNIQEQESGQFRVINTYGETALWRFMRSHSTDILMAQQACLNRYQDLQEEITRDIESGTLYPWHLLAQLNADKFFSDIMESIIGAIFVDSGDNIHECQNFLERIGLVPYLLRILAENVDTIHPKTALGHLAGSAKIDYDIQLEDNNYGLYRCAIKIMDIEVISAENTPGCLTKDEAMVRAAYTAVKLLST